MVAGSRDPDRAVLVETDCGLDLYIYVVDQRRGRDWSEPPTLVKRGLDVGPYCGEGVLKAGADGALELTIANDWHPPRSSETLTIRYRGGDFVVSAYRSWTSRFSGPDAADTSPRDATCVIDFLAGKAVRDGEPGRIDRPAPKLADWGDNEIELCAVPEPAPHARRALSAPD